MPIKKLKDGRHHWVQTFHHPNDLCEEETLEQVKGIGKAKQQQLATIGFMKLIHIKNATISQLQDVAMDSGNKFALT